MQPRYLDIPLPADDVSFMELCAEIWKQEWQTDSVQVNGRNGQEQQGVDVFGRPNNGTDYYGIQCKVRSYQGTKLPKLTEKEIRAEVESALNFQPPLKQLIIATTAPHDVEMQTIARTITEEHAKHGLFPVDVLGASEIRRRMDRYPAVHSWYQSLGPVEHKIETKLKEQSDDIQKILEAVTKGNGQEFDALVNSQIDAACSLIDVHKPHAAIFILQKIWEAIGDKLSNKHKYRILGNIGNACVLLGDFRTAGTNFIEASQFASNDDKAFAQTAWGYVLSDELILAEKTLQEGLKHFPDSGRLQAIRIMIAKAKDDALDPASIILTEFLNDPNVAFTTSRIFFGQKKPEEATKWIKIAYGSDSNNWQFRKAYAETLLGRVENSGYFVQGGAKDLQDDFNEATRELEEIWKIVREGEHIEASAVIASEVALEKKVRGDINGAKEVISAGLNMGKSILLLQLAAEMASTEGDYKKAITLYERIDPAIFPQRDFFIANMQVALNEREKAIDTLFDAASNDALPDELKVVARAQGLELKAKNNLDEALKEVRQLVSEQPSIIPYRIALSGILRESGNRTEALIQAEAARGILTVSSKPTDRVAIADSFFRLDEYDEAVAILSALAPAPVDSPLKRHLLDSLYHADCIAELRRQLDEIPDSEKTDPFYSRLEIGFQIRIGKHDEAIKLLSAYLDSDPKDIRMRLLWINLLERLSKKDELAKYLAVNTDLAEGTAAERMKFACVLMRNNQTDNALKLGYELASRNANDPDVQLGYVSMIFATRTYEPFEKVIIAPNFGFTIEPINGGKQSSYVIEPGSIFDNSVQISPDHPIAQSVIGKTVGDVVEIPYNRFLKTKEKVVAVRHKFLMLFDEIGDTFNLRFPNHNGFFKLSMPKKADGSLDLANMFRVIDERHAQAELIKEQAEQASFPIPIIARLRRQNSVETWEQLVADDNRGIRSCIGTGDELEAALSFLRSSEKGFVFDPVTLNLLQILNLNKAFVSLGRPLYVTRSAIESLSHLVDELQSNRDGYKTVGKVEDRYVATEISANVISERISQLRALMEWVKKNCIELPAFSKTDVPPIIRQFSRMIEPAFMDAVTAARDSKLILVSEDMPYRQIAQMVGVEGIWLYPIIILMLEKGALKQETAFEAIENLVFLNHKFTPINSQILLHRAQKSGWKLTPDVQKLIDTTIKPDAEIKSGAMVFIGFVQSMFITHVPRKIRGVFFKAALNAFERHYLGMLTNIHSAFYHAAERIFPGKSLIEMRLRQEWKSCVDEWFKEAKQKQKNQPA